MATQVACATVILATENHQSTGKGSMKKVIVITGGSRGIGAATALLAAQQGYRICINYLRDEEAAHRVQEQVRALGAQAITVRADVSDEDEVIQLFRHTSRVDEMSEFRMLQTLKTNVLGPMLCAKHAVLRMSPRHGGQGGSIVNVSSAAARLGSANEYVDYAASKGALDTFTLGLSKETEFHALSGDPDRVSKLEPGIPMGRGGRAEEVAEGIIWLLSDKASYTTGTFLDLAGGR